MIDNLMSPLSWINDFDTTLHTFRYGLNYLSRCWTTSGRPTISLVMGQNMLENGKIPPPMLSILKKLKEGKNLNELVHGPLALDA